MNEINKIIDKYSSEFYLIFSSIQASNWGDQRTALNYLNKYWIEKSDYEHKWKLVQNCIFINQNSGYPDLVFNKDFTLYADLGGVLFEKSDFRVFQEFLKEIGESTFLIIENTFGKLDAPQLRMQYPINITWDELMSGNFLSSVLFESSVNEYFVFGGKSDWGMYAPNECENPLNIFGSKGQSLNALKKHFRQTKEDWEEIKRWLPPIYKNKIECNFKN